MTHAHLAALSLAAGLLALPAAAQKVTLKDPTGDDTGPGTYKYPTDPVYKKGSFDLTGLTVEKSGSKVNLDVALNSTLEDPWKMGTGFAVQMVFVFIDTDGKAGSGHRESLPGLNVQFAPGSEWDRVVILSPQSPSRLQAEVQRKAGALKGAVVIPSRVKGAGRFLSATVDAAALGGGDPSTWGYQVVVQSNEGFPANDDLLTRKVNEYEGQHRFGGGTDTDCDPHAMDILAGAGKGTPDEADTQRKQLAYACSEDGSAKQRATLTMVRPR